MPLCRLPGLEFRELNARATVFGLLEVLRAAILPGLFQGLLLARLVGLLLGDREATFPAVFREAFFGLGASMLGRTVREPLSGLFDGLRFAGELCRETM